MVANATNDRLGTVSESGFSLGFDWKSQYIDKLATEGLERFSQLSASPDTTIILAGPARYTGLSGAAALIPIGLCDGLSIQTSASVQPLYEIGSNRTFMTRGKTQYSMSMGKLLADQKNILAALTAAAYRPTMAVDGTNAPGASSPNPDIQMNLGAETFSTPFGVLLVFKTKGGDTSGGYGKALTAIYCESCMFQNYGFNVANQSPVITESVSLIFDRVVPVSFA